LKRFLILIIILSACTPIPSSVTSPAPTRQIQAVEFSGRVVDDAGAPVPQANIRINSRVVLTDADGWFHMPSNGSTEWVTVYKSGYITRTRAAAAGTAVLIRVSKDDGKTIVLKFTGDVMFGRRFFDPNSDGSPDDGLLPVNPSVEDHL